MQVRHDYILRALFWATMTFWLYTWIYFSMADAATIDPVAVGSGVANTMNNPIPVAIAGVVIIALFFLLKGPLMKWLQKQQDKKNEQKVQNTTQTTANENDKLNQDFHP